MDDAAAEAAKHHEVAGLLREVTHDVAVTHHDLVPLEGGKRESKRVSSTRDSKRRSGKAGAPALAVDPADDAIKRGCYHVALATAATSSNLMGLGFIAALGLGVAAAGGLTLKLQSDMVAEIAHIRGKDLSPEARQRLMLVLSGTAQGVGSAVQVASAAATKEMEVVASRVAANAAAFTFFEAAAPMVLPSLITVSAAVVSTYIIGERAKQYFDAQGPLESWADSARALSGLDERKIMTWVSDAVWNQTLHVRLILARIRNAFTCSYFAAKAAPSTALSVPPSTPGGEESLTKHST
jgi:hypothetical protein